MINYSVRQLHRKSKKEYSNLPFKTLKINLITFGFLLSGLDSSMKMEHNRVVLEMGLEDNGLHFFPRLW
jgi:hypothetical protein